MLLVAFSLVMGFMSSCVGLKPSTSPSSGKLLETFFTGDEGTQYFIKPLVFKNDQKELIMLDLTFRYKDEIEDSALLRLSLYTNELQKNLTAVTFGNGASQFSSSQIELMFSERTKHHLHSRFSLKMPLADVQSLFSESNWQLEIVSGKQQYQFTANSKTKKNISKLYHSVFSIL